MSHVAPLVQSAFDTITSDMDRFAYLLKQRMTRMTSESAASLSEIDGRIAELEKRSLRLDRLLTRHTLARLTLVGALMALVTLCGSFVAVALTINAKQPPAPPLIQVPADLQGSRMIRGVGGLGEVIVLPPGMIPARCPIVAGDGRTCIRREE